MPRNRFYTSKAKVLSHTFVSEYLISQVPCIKQVIGLFQNTQKLFNEKSGYCAMYYIVYLLTYIMLVVTKAAADEGYADEGEVADDEFAEEGEGEEEEEGAKSSGEITVCSNPCLENDGFADDKTQPEETPTVQVECIHGTEAKPLAAKKGEEGEAEEGGEAEGGEAEFDLKKKKKSGLKKKKSAGKSNSKPSTSKSKLVGFNF